MSEEASARATRARELRHEALGLEPERLLTLYRQMVLARAIDRRMWVLNRQGKAPFVISGQGHEAAQVGAAAALRPGVDWLCPYYRDLAFCLALGLTPLEAVQLVKRNGTSPTAYFILHKSKQSARSMSTGVELPGKTAPHLVYVD